MVTKAQKEETIQTLKEKFSKAKSVFATSQLGLTVAEITKLRNAIRPNVAEFKIAKNTLFRKASEGTPFEALAKDLKGPTAFLFCYEDAIAPAGHVKKFSATANNKVTFNGAYLDGEILDKEAATKVAGLPSKEVLLSQIAGMIVQPASMIAYILKELGEKPESEKLLKEFIVATSVDASSGEGQEENQ